MAIEETSNSVTLSAENQRNERRVGQSWYIFSPAIIPPGGDPARPILIASDKPPSIPQPGMGGKSHLCFHLSTHHFLLESHGVNRVVTYLTDPISYRFIFAAWTFAAR